MMTIKKKMMMHDDDDDNDGNDDNDEGTSAMSWIWIELLILSSVIWLLMTEQTDVVGESAALLFPSLFELVVLWKKIFKEKNVRMF